MAGTTRSSSVAGPAPLQASKVVALLLLLLLADDDGEEGGRGSTKVLQSRALYITTGQSLCPRVCLFASLCRQQPVTGVWCAAGGRDGCGRRLGCSFSHCRCNGTHQAAWCVHACVWGGVTTLFYGFVEGHLVDWDGLCCCCCCCCCRHGG